MINYMKSPNSPDIPNSLNEHWMPFSSNKDFKKNPRLIANAKGVYLKTHHQTKSYCSIRWDAPSLLN